MRLYHVHMGFVGEGGKEKENYEKCKFIMENYYRLQNQNKYLTENVIFLGRKMVDQLSVWKQGKNSD